MLFLQNDTSPKKKTLLFEERKVVYDRTMGELCQSDLIRRVLNKTTPPWALHPKNHHKLMLQVVFSLSESILSLRGGIWANLRVGSCDCDLLQEAELKEIDHSDDNIFFLHYTHHNDFILICLRNKTRAGAGWKRIPAVDLSLRVLTAYVISLALYKQVIVPHEAYELPLCEIFERFSSLNPRCHFVFNTKGQPYSRTALTQEFIRLGIPKIQDARKAISNEVLSKEHHWPSERAAILMKSTTKGMATSEKQVRNRYGDRFLGGQSEGAIGEHFLEVLQFNAHIQHLSVLPRDCVYDENGEFIGHEYWLAKVLRTDVVESNNRGRNSCDDDPHDIAQGSGLDVLVAFMTQLPNGAWVLPDASGEFFMVLPNSVVHEGTLNGAMDYVYSAEMGGYTSQCHSGEEVGFSASPHFTNKPCEAAVREWLNGEELLDNVGPTEAEFKRRRRLGSKLIREPWIGRLMLTSYGRLVKVLSSCGGDDAVEVVELPLVNDIQGQKAGRGVELRYRIALPQYEKRARLKLQSTLSDGTQEVLLLGPADWHVYLTHPSDRLLRNCGTWLKCNPVEHSSPTIQNELQSSSPPRSTRKQPVAFKNKTHNNNKMKYLAKKKPNKKLKEETSTAHTSLKKRKSQGRRSPSASSLVQICWIDCIDEM